MKFFLFPILFFVTSSYGQNIESFLGIKFGTSIDSVKRIMLSKPGCLIDKKNSDSTQLVFDGVKFAGRETVLMQFKFVNKRFHTGIAFIKPRLTSQTVELYNTIKGEVNEKYYTTSEDFETYKSPYEKGDGYTESAIKLGKAIFEAYWKSKKNSQTEDEDNYICVEITDGLLIKISYQDGALVKIASSQDKAKKSLDY